MLNGKNSNAKNVTGITTNIHTSKVILARLLQEWKHAQGTFGWSVVNSYQMHL